MAFSVPSFQAVEYDTTIDVFIVRTTGQVKPAIFCF